MKKTKKNKKKEEEKKKRREKKKKRASVVQCRPKGTVQHRPPAPPSTTTEASHRQKQPANQPTSWERTTKDTNHNHRAIKVSITSRKESPRDRQSGAR